LTERFIDSSAKENRLCSGVTAVGGPKRANQSGRGKYGKQQILKWLSADVRAVSAARSKHGLCIYPCIRKTFYSAINCHNMKTWL
jgi:hypothetical protein